MDSDMRENLIGVEKPMDSETATQRSRKLCSFVKNREQSCRLTAKLSMHYEEQAAAICSSHQKACRVAVFSIQAALEFIDALHSRDKEQTERSEEVNNMLAIPLESEPSARDSDGHGARVIPPSNHPVDDTNGSALNRSPSHSTGSHYYNQTHQALGHDDSNPSRSLLLSGESDHAVTSNNVPGHVEMFHLAVLISDAACQFFNGIDGLDVDGQDKEQTERPEEVNNLTSPLCEGSFMEEYGVDSLLHNAVSSESEPSATDSDGHGTRVIPPNQTVPDIVNDTNGSAVNRSPLHSIDSHDFHSYGQTHQAPFQGHDDSNPIWSSSLSIRSDHPVTNNSMPLNMASHYSRLEQGLRPLNSNANRPHHATRVTTSVWIVSVTGIGFEAVSAFFDQVSTPRKPHYALYGMLLSIVGVVVSILDLIHNAMEQNGVASASEMRWRILPEVFGLALACIQCISSALQFSFLCRHAENPVKVSLVPFLFLFVLFAFKYRNERN